MSILASATNSHFAHNIFHFNFKPSHEGLLLLPIPDKDVIFVVRYLLADCPMASALAR